jgi:hypothetical protein
MAPVTGAKLKDNTAQLWLGGLAGVMYPGEEVTTVAKTSSVKPLLDGLAVTTARVVAFLGNDLTTSGRLKVSISGTEIETVAVQSKRFTGDQLVVTAHDGTEISFGVILGPDKDLLVGAIGQLAATGVPQDVGQAMAAHNQQTAQVNEAWAQVPVVGGNPTEKAWKAIRDHATPGETPWFVIGSGVKGVFAAFEDRCMIVKTGAMTSMMAGSLGGGRTTTFHYSDITGIEYNSGLLAGVLEVLTPSYQGTSNKDYWRGTTKKRNANSDDPWTLSNCLPLDKPVYQKALPRLNEMRAKISESKKPTAVRSAPTSQPPAGGGLADELVKLAALKEQGILDYDEFQAAKQAAIARFANP